MTGAKGRSQSVLNDLSWECRVTPDILEAAKNSNLYFGKVNESLYVKSLKCKFLNIYVTYLFSCMKFE